jgi:hypothetical protein
MVFALKLAQAFAYRVIDRLINRQDFVEVDKENFPLELICLNELGQFRFLKTVRFAHKPFRPVTVYGPLEMLLTTAKACLQSGFTCCGRPSIPGKHRENRKALPAAEQCVDGLAAFEFFSAGKTEERHENRITNDEKRS